MDDDVRFRCSIIQTVGFADGQVMMASSEDGLTKIIGRTNLVIEKYFIQNSLFNTKKTKVIKIRKDQ